MRLSPWGRVVLVSAALVFGGILALLAADVGTQRERLVSYPVTGSVNEVSLDLGDASVEIVGGGPREDVDVQRRERYSFGRPAETQRTVGAGVFALRSRCPDSVPDACSTAYRLIVPDNVPIELRTTTGAVRLRGYRGSARILTGSGDVDVGGFCGFSLQARAESGDVAARTECPVQRLALRSITGSIHAAVPQGRYRVDAQSASGRQSVRGLASTTDAPFSIQALSSSGDVIVERGS